MREILAYIKIMRPLNLFQGAIAIIVCATLMAQYPPWWRILLGIAVVWAYTGAGNALNDFYDAEIDRINRPTRPIPAGLIRRENARLFAAILFILGSLLALPLMNPHLAGLLVIALLLLTTYSTVFKRRPLWGNIVVSAILGLAFVFAAIIFGDYRRGLPPALLAFGFNLIREIVKDMQDIEGDRAVRARTLPLKYGLSPARNLVIAFTLLLAVLAPLPYVMGIYGKFYLLVLITAVEFPLLYVIYSIRKDHSPVNCGHLASVLKADIFFGLLAIFVGKF